MAIEMTNPIVAVLVGAGDEVTDSIDEKQGYTDSFRNSTDIVRTLGALIGYGIQVLAPRQEKWGVALAIPYTTLLVKSVADPIRNAIGGTPTATNFNAKQTRAEREAAAAAAKARSYANRWPATRQEPEFANVRLV